MCMSMYLFIFINIHHDNLRVQVIVIDLLNVRRPVLDREEVERGVGGGGKVGPAELACHGWP